MSLNAGDSFFAPWPSEEHGVRHLYFVISDPAMDAQRVVLVPLMTWSERLDTVETVCMVRPGDHPFVRHDSYINYDCAKEVSLEELEKRLDEKRLRKGQPATRDLLARIREGADKSERLKLELRDILEDQELVDPL